MHLAAKKGYTKII